MCSYVRPPCRSGAPRRRSEARNGAPTVPGAGKHHAARSRHVAIWRSARAYLSVEAAAVVQHASSLQKLHTPGACEACRRLRMARPQRLFLQSSTHTRGSTGSEVWLRGCCGPKEQARHGATLGAWCLETPFRSSETVALKSLLEEWKGPNILHNCSTGEARCRV
jgi:hypothetical protein